MIEYLKELFTHYPYGVKAIITIKHRSKWDYHRINTTKVYEARICTYYTFWNRIFGEYYTEDIKVFDSHEENALEQAKQWAAFRYNEIIADEVRKEEDRKAKPIWKIPPG